MRDHRTDPNCTRRLLERLNMKKYENRSLDHTYLYVSPGTQQTPVMINMLNSLGEDGWRPVAFQGDPENEFFILLTREVPGGA